MEDLERDREIMGYWEQKKYGNGDRYAVNERVRLLERLEKMWILLRMETIDKTAIQLLMWDQVVELKTSKRSERIRNEMPVINTDMTYWLPSF